ncbi:argininosuccinate lyase [Lactobacillus sp. CBA3606]|uniref:argininosuccinate lyase n=1 Tax=Lactobacillus sp. CBA3606 TaxID=2099789 RepID=UPI000CFD14EB|nr:argininosuccinate lyase [Lactobacillus sp. CBA3606]AVK64545.1 argininosuccinate lyase [Lactobacillus sp. CBA3606]
MSTKKLWGGRFTATGAKYVDEFGASIGFDQLLAAEDIAGSLAHVKMLKKTGILPANEVDQIVAGLEKLSEQLAAGDLTFDTVNEDIHMNIEALLTAEIGPVAGKLHTARSRNDQVATDFHLYLKHQLPQVLDRLQALETVLVDKASENIETIMPGYTHLQHAQPISYAHYLLAYYQMFKRDMERFEFNQQHTDISPLGAAALAGTTFPIDREYSAKLLGFSAVYHNSLDAVSDRDFVLEFLSNAAILMMHLSRFCEELVAWSSYEFKYISLSDQFSTGSSIMPQKKNPDMAELIRGKSGRVYGNLMSLLTVMKAIPLAYNKDLQEDKEGAFDTVTTVLTSLHVFTGMLATLTVNEDQMAAATVNDFSNATELADYLANKGIPFREAHAIVGKLVLDGLQKHRPLQDIPLAEYQQISPLIEADVYHDLDAKVAVERRHSLGGTGFDQIKLELAHARTQLAAYQSETDQN